MNASNWLSTKLNLLRNSAPASVPPEEVARSTRERLDATVRKQKEALSPRSLRRGVAVDHDVRLDASGEEHAMTSVFTHRDPRGRKGQRASN